MKTIISIPALALGFVAPLTSAFAASILSIADIVTTGPGQNAYVIDSASGGNPGNFTGSSASSLVFSHAVTEPTKNGYFTASFAETSLQNVGDKLSLTFTVTGSNLRSSSGQGFRFGLFNVSDIDGPFTDATGYRASYAGSSNTANGLYERANSISKDNLWDGSAATRFSDSTAPSSNFSPYMPQGAGASWLTGSLTLELLAGNQIKITSFLGDSPVSYAIDTAGTTATFNALSFFLVNNTGGTATLTFSDLNVSFTAIPEPATAAALLSGFILLIVSAVRIHRRNVVAK
ncbi:hypothetical protein OpiT1DRAFT_01917 [Opitutaceae bacterium TAV1]|nr:hypothetical protein OpiT1DRAFT_01917 [Opitutaceae bacterium TAV1]